MKKNYLFFTAILIVLACNRHPKVGDKPVYIPVDPVLYREIYVQDSMMFAAYNEHNVAKLMSFFAENLEFYHDAGGLSDFHYTEKGLTTLFEQNRTTGLRRDMVAGTLEVYPINNYGAIETYRHRFCHKENGKDDCGTFKNMMIWKKTPEGWKVTRVISYDH